MTARRLVLSALLMAVLAFAVGHLLAVWHCQRDQLLAAGGETRVASGSAQAAPKQLLGERRAAAAAGLAALAAAAGLAATSLSEGLALFLAGYAVLGLTMTTELVVLGYRRVPWPLLPLGPGEDATSVIVAFGLLVLLIGGAFYRAALSNARAEPRLGRRPRQRPRVEAARRRVAESRRPMRPDRPLDDTAAQPTQPADWGDDDARSED